MEQERLKRRRRVESGDPGPEMVRERIGDRRLRKFCGSMCAIADAGGMQADGTKGHERTEVIGPSSVHAGVTVRGEHRAVDGLARVQRALSDES